MEGALRAVLRVCVAGWWLGWKCGMYWINRLWGWIADRLQTVMVLKYLIKDYPITTLYFGIANVVANGLVMLRYVVSR